VDDDGYLQVEAIEDIMVSESDSSGYDSDDDVQDDLDDFLVSQQGQVCVCVCVWPRPSLPSPPPPFPCCLYSHFDAVQ
jgi:hypothetical protein